MALGSLGAMTKTIPILPNRYLLALGLRVGAPRSETCLYRCERCSQNFAHEISRDEPLACPSGCNRLLLQVVVGRHGKVRDMMSFDDLQRGLLEAVLPELERFYEQHEAELGSFGAGMAEALESIRAVMDTPGYEDPEAFLYRLARRINPIGVGPIPDCAPYPVMPGEPILGAWFATERILELGAADESLGIEKLRRLALDLGGSVKVAS